MAYCLLVIISVFLSYFSSTANVWDRKKDSYQIIQTFFLQNSKAIDSTYGSIRQDVSISSALFSIYFEYMLLETLNVGFNIFGGYHYNKSDTKFNGNQFGFEFVEFFGRKTVFERGNFSASIKGLVKLPGLYKEDEAPYQFFKKHNDYEISLELGYGINNNNYYIDPKNTSNNFISTAFRLRQKDVINETQGIVELTYGHKVTESNIFLIQFQKINFLYNSMISNSNFFDNTKVFFQSFDIFSNEGIFKLSASVVSEFDASNLIQIGAYSSIHSSFFSTNHLNYNITGIFFSIWSHG